MLQQNYLLNLWWFEGGNTLTVLSSNTDSFDVAVSYLNIKKGDNNIMKDIPVIEPKREL